MRILSLLLSVMVCAAAHAGVKTERVEYKVGDKTFEGVLAYNDQVPADAKNPGVLVCHEWWGCNDYAEARAKKLAELGYVAFALDMFGKGSITKDAKQAGEWAGQVMGDAKALADRASAGLKVLAENPRVDSKRLGVIGYCMGGTVALELARSGREYTQNLKAIVAFHASTIAANDPAGNANIKGSVLICHGAEDGFVKPEQIERFHAQMKDAKIDYQFVSYGGAVHSFTNPNADKANIEGVRHNAAADKRSWATMTFLFQQVFLNW